MGGVMSSAVSYQSKTPANRSRKQQVESRVRDRLRASPYHSVRDVQCEYDTGVLTLRGTMPSYYCVQLAITLARALLDRDVEIRNSMQVAGDKSD